MQSAFHCMAESSDYYEKYCFVLNLRITLSNSFIVHFVAVEISMEINRRHFFWRDLSMDS